MPELLLRVPPAFCCLLFVSRAYLVLKKASMCEPSIAVILTW